VWGFFAAVVVLAAASAALSIAAYGGHLDSENWLFAYWALLLGWTVAVAFGVVWLLRRVGFIVVVAILAAGTVAMLILAFAGRHRSEIWSSGWSALLLAWGVAGVYGVVRLLLAVVGLSGRRARGGPA
jgi:hypothetical protein